MLLGCRRIAAQQASDAANVPQTNMAGQPGGASIRGGGGGPPLGTKYQGLSKEDMQIAMRLEKLKEGKKAGACDFI